MTLTVMVEQVKDAFAAIVGAEKCNHEIPAGVTPQVWHTSYPMPLDDISPEEHKEKHAGPAGRSLAAIGIDAGCNAFAPLEAKFLTDPVLLKGLKYKGRPHIVVYARGWRT